MKELFEMVGLSLPRDCKLMPVLVVSTVVWFVTLGWIVVDVRAVTAYVLFVLANMAWWAAFLYCGERGVEEAEEDVTGSD